VVIAAALTGGTRQLFGAPEFALMKDSAVLVNIARGGLIDTEALVAALAAGQIGGAGLDVTDPEPLPAGHALWTEPRALITPHNADTPEMIAPLFAERLRANLVAAGGGGEFAGVVDVEHGY
jgi:phosphoglycerate dehydrogenase-like enzyme